MFYLIVALAIFVAGVGTGWKGDELKHSIAEAARVKAQVVAQAAEDKRTNTIAARFDKAIAALRTSNAAINQQVTHELAQAVYTQCVLPDSGRMLLDSDADTINDSLGFARAVPAAAAPAAKPAGQVNDGGSPAARQGLDDAIRRLRATSKSTK